MSRGVCGFCRMKTHIFLSVVLHNVPSPALFIVTFLFQGKVEGISARIARSHVRTVACLVKLSFAPAPKMGLFETADFILFFYQINTSFSYLLISMFMFPLFTS